MQLIHRHERLIFHAKSLNACTILGRCGYSLVIAELVYCIKQEPYIVCRKIQHISITSFAIKFPILVASILVGRRFITVDILTTPFHGPFAELLSSSIQLIRQCSQSE